MVHVAGLLQLECVGGGAEIEVIDVNYYSGDDDEDRNHDQREAGIDSFTAPYREDDADTQGE